MGVLSLEVEKGLYLGIDFGTTNSVVSIYHYDTNEVHTLKIDGYTVFPSVVQFDKEEDELIRVFGIEAREAAIIYPESTVSSVKRQLEIDEPLVIKVMDDELTFEAETIVSELLAHLKEQADIYIREELNIVGTFSGCVITVPANSTDKQKRKMKKAAVMAGFLEDNVYLRLEPAAAAINYATTINEDKKVLVYDFGGGTFDACLLEVIKQEEEPEISILSTFGDNYLGGNDIDQLMVDIIYDEFLRLSEGEIDLFDFTKDDGMTVRDKKMAIVRMKQIANHTKESLSTTSSAKVVLAPFIQSPMIISIQLEITRDAFYNHKRKYQLDDSDQIYDKMKGLSVIDLVAKSIKCIEKCIQGASLEVKDIDEVFLVGGSSALIEVHRQIVKLFGKEPYKAKISPALSISRGAAHYCKQIMLPSLKGPKVIETTIHSLGVEIAGRRYLEIIGQGISIPEEGLTVEAPFTLETNFDDLTSLAIVVFEDLEPSKFNRKFVYEEGIKRLAATMLRGIPPMAKGEMKVKVIFKLSRDNTLTVEAIALGSEELRTTLAVDDLYEK